jgi:hypothetical protein
MKSSMDDESALAHLRIILTFARKILICGCQNCQRALRDYLRFGSLTADIRCLDAEKCGANKQSSPKYVERHHPFLDCFGGSLGLFLNQRLSLELNQFSEGNRENKKSCEPSHHAIRAERSNNESGLECEPMAEDNGERSTRKYKLR